MRIAAAVTFLAMASPAAAQTRDSTARGEYPPLALWVSASAGPGYASNYATARLGGEIALHGAYGNWVAVVRRGAESGIESGGAWDDALMLGRRITRPNVTLLWAVGPAAVHGDSSGGSWSALNGRARGAIAFTAQGAVTAHVVGLGVSTFGAWGPGLSYAGVGLALHAGWIQ